MKVLIIEDDPNIVDFLRSAFEVGWPEARIETAHNGNQGLTSAENSHPDIILLDLRLPDMNGFDVLKNIRLSTAIPVIIVTVTNDENYVVRGLSFGADDYVVKPLRPLELIASMKSLLKKTLKSEDLTMTCGDLHFGSSIKELFKGDRQITLTDTEGRLLNILMKKAGSLVTYDQLATELWGTSDLGYQRNLKVHIRHLRQKIEVNPSHPRIILNRIAAGYMLSKSL